MEHVVYDSGALIAIDSGNELSFRRHLKRITARHRVIVPAPWRPRWSATHGAKRG